MSKLAVLAAIAAVTLTSIGTFPAAAQSNYPGSNCTYRCDTPKAAKDSCSSQIGHLRRVYPAQVMGIEDHHRVWVTEFCLTQGLFRADGNAAYLRTALADNEVINDVLRSRGYFPEDVFAVRMMGDDTISLYVHRFND